MLLDMSTLTVRYRRFLSVGLISHNFFVAEAVSCQPANVETWVWYQISSRGVSSRQGDIETGFLPNSV